MNILHYSLGFPPYRTGGLTKFCLDLMKQQIKEGHSVSLLWPGEIKLISHNTRIRTHKPINWIGNYEVINPLPVPFDEGIKDFDAFKTTGEEAPYETLIAQIKPDIIHVHTLMGMHKAFLDVAKRKGVRLVFTAHDFFPICTKVTMFRNSRICDCAETCEGCSVCNNTALSLGKIRILQSPLYRKFKDTTLVKRFRKQHREGFLGELIENDGITVGTVDEYLSLRKHNRSVLEMMDIIHYNSSVTRRAYEQVFELTNCIVIPISHAGIADHRITRIYSDEELRIRYIGPRAKGKGFKILQEAVERLWKDGRRVVLDVHFFMEDKPVYINCHKRFAPDELRRILEETDILVCPSIWYETFGYTVLEALSFGVPVIVSDTVGAKDIIAEGAGIVIGNISADKLYDALKEIDSETLKNMNQAITQSQKIITIEEVSKEIMEKAYML